MTAEVPRATIFLITYNQELFVRDAVRSVLGQDYPNLQIILSDDCSRDATFDLIRAEAHAYYGPHEVIVRQPPRNLGLVRHLYNVAELADSELLICAEGDDISYPHRVRTLVEVWQRSGADALMSNWDVIDHEGRIVRRGRPPGKSDLRTEQYFLGRNPRLLTGATAAYSAEALRRISCPSDPVFAEDLYISLLLAWRDRSVCYVEEPLVGYRVHSTSLTHIDRSRQPLAEQERDAARWSGQMASQLRLFERMVVDGSPSLQHWGTAVPVDRQVIADDIAFNKFRSTWLDSSFVQRLLALRRFRDPRQRRWLLPRLFGVAGVAALRRLGTMLAYARLDQSR